LCLSDILLIPYDSDFTIKGGSLANDYSSPIKLFEYLSAGKPIVASNLSSFNEILKDGMNSILVNPDSINEISESIEKLLNDKALRDNLSSNSLELSKRFTWINRAKGMISL
jgi:glycosyltransferase involved in cell wall biosynthesis